MDWLPNELCLMIGSYVNKHLFSIKHSSCMTSKYYVLASHEREAIILAMEKETKRFDNNLTAREIREFIGWCVKRARTYNEEECDKIWGKPDYSDYDGWVIRSRLAIMHKYIETFINLFKEKFIIEKADISQSFVLQ